MRRLKYLLAVLIASTAFGAPFQSSRYFKNSGGLVDHISPLLVPDQNASAVQNITMDDRGQLSKRSGYSRLNSAGSMTSSAVTGGGYHNAASGSSFFGVVVGTNVYRTGNTFAGTYTQVTGTVTVTSSASNLVQVTSVNDNLVFCNDSDKPFYLASTGNAVHISTGLFTGAKTCGTYGSYLVIGNTTESSVAYPSRVRWSSIQNTNDFPANNYIDIEPNDGDRIVSLISFGDSIYVFKKRSIYRVLITGLDGADAFIIRPVVRNMGAWAKNSVRVVPGEGIFFLAQNTVYQLNNSESATYSGNGLTPIGDPIQRTFDTINRAQWANAVAVVYPKRYQYWISVATGSATTNGEILVYDYIQKAWSVYSGIAANALAQAEDSNGNNIILSGDYAGNQYKQDTGTSDNPAGVATAITGSYTTGELSLGTPEITKGFKYLYVFSQVDVTTTLTVEAAYDYMSAYESTISIDLGQAGALYNTAVYDTDVFPAIAYKVSRVELNRSARDIRLRFSNASAGSIVGVIGWSIIYTLEDFKQ